MACRGAAERVDELADVAGIGECVLARIASRSCQHDFPDVKKLSQRERRGVPGRGNHELRSVKRGWHPAGAAEILQPSGPFRIYPPWPRIVSDHAKTICQLARHLAQP